MKNRLFFLSAFLVLILFSNQVFAEGLKEAGASLLLPTTGQAMNGQLGNTKTKIMGGVEVISVAAVTIVGIATGGGAVLLAAAPLAANHLWSAADAYHSAKTKRDPVAEQQLLEAQRNLDLSRQGRYEREREYQSDVRDRIRRAGELAEG